MKCFLFIFCLFSFNLHSQDFDLTPAEVESRIHLLDYDKNFKVVSVIPTRKKKEYTIFQIRLESIHPWSNTPFITEFFWYKPNDHKKRALLTIIPPVIDITPFDKIWAHQFTKEHNFNVFILKYNEKINDERRPLADMNRVFVSIMTSARLILDFAETQNEIDTSKIGTYGMSLGAILSALFLGIEPRVSAAVVIVGAGNLPEVLAHSNQAIIKKLREERMEAEKIETVEELEKRVKETFLFDPLIFASRRSPQDVYMVIGNDDTNVPTKNQLELWEKFGQPENRRFPGQHFPVIFKNLFQHKYIYEFFNKRLNIISN